MVTDEKSLKPNNELAKSQEQAMTSLPARKMEAMWVMKDSFTTTQSGKLTTSSEAGGDKRQVKRSIKTQVQKDEANGNPNQVAGLDQPDQPSQNAETTDQVTEQLWSVSNPPQPSIHIAISEELRNEFIEGYVKDKQFKTIYTETSEAINTRSQGKKFLKTDDGLLYFLNADFQPRLCVPRQKRQAILEEAHESPLEMAHLQMEQLWLKLSSKFYWKRMKIDIEEFCKTCDMCQKTKNSNFKKYGFLIPNPILTRLYKSASLTLIIDLLWSQEYNVILVIVDRLLKHAQFMPMTTRINTEGFALLFVKNIVLRYGLPSSIISDHDPQWMSDFWRSIVKHLKTRMALSSLHHPQHDGQTEVVNKTLESMLRAYMSEDQSSWAEWLHLLEFTYNSHIHTSTSLTPFQLLLGFQLSSPLSRITPELDKSEVNYSLSAESRNFLEQIRIH